MTNEQRKALYSAYLMLNAWRGERENRNAPDHPELDSVILECRDALYKSTA